MACRCTIRRGSGEATTRRQASPSRRTVQAWRSAAARLALGIDRPDELGGRREARVVAIDDHPGEDGDGLLLGDGVVELELEHVADLALGLGAEDVQRIGRGLGVGVAHERQQPHLRPVAVRHDELVVAGHARQGHRGGACRAGLVGRLERLAAPEQRVAPEGHDRARPPVRIARGAHR
jgi:hypothetical protein